jgi:error-prone DNA polymerase
MVHWDKDSCSDAGFLKIDFLGLGMLSAVERCVDLIARRTGEIIDLSRIPYDDPQTFASIQEADTTGVFQIESRAQMASLRRTRPETLEEITIQVAIVRPGPIQGGAVNPYIERRQRLREDPSYVVPYEHPSLEPVLRETLGAIIFQDQVIEVAMAFAGFSAGEAEGLRRAMSRKRSEAAIMAHHDAFVRGAQATHPDVTPDLAERVWSMVVGFSGFGFPKAHGAAFGLLAYQSAWLRIHHPLEFLCALLDEQPMGFYPSDALIHEAQRREIEVRPPDIGRSSVGCTIEDDAVRVGLGYVLGVRADEIAALVRAREEGGPFRSLEDLASRAGAGRASLDTLAWSGACDELAGDRRSALWMLGAAAPGRRLERHGADVQLALPLDLPAPPRLRRLGAWDEMIADYATTGISVDAHPVGLLRPSLEARGAVSSRGLEGLHHRRQVRIGGLVVARQRPGTAKGIAFILLEDEFGTVNLVVPPAIYERDRLAVRSEPLVMAEGRVERFASAGGAINVLVERLSALDAPGRLAAEVKELGRNLAIVGADRGDEAEEQLAVAAGGGGGRGDFRAVAPPVLSFTSGRQR